MIARFAIPFFITVGFIVLPLLLFLLCRKLLPNKRYGTVVGILLAALEIALVAYGMTGGFQPLEGPENPGAVGRTTRNAFGL